MNGPTLNGPSMNLERIAVLEEVRGLVDTKIRSYHRARPIKSVLVALRADIDNLIETATLAWQQTR